MCLERELCSEARKLADAGKHTVGIEDKRTPAQTQYEMFYILKYYILLEPKCVNIVVYLHKQAKAYNAIFTNVINSLKDKGTLFLQ